MARSSETSACLGLLLVRGDDGLIARVPRLGFTTAESQQQSLNV